MKENIIFVLIAVDNAGNANEECIKQVKVDLGIPETLCIFIGQGSNNRFYKNVEIRVLGSDKGSGVKDTFYKLDNEGFKTYYQPIIHRYIRRTYYRILLNRLYRKPRTNKNYNLYNIKFKL